MLVNLVVFEISEIIIPRSLLNVDARTIEWDACFLGHFLGIGCTLTASFNFLYYLVDGGEHLNYLKYCMLLKSNCSEVTDSYE